MYQLPPIAGMDGLPAIMAQPDWAAIDPEKAPHCPLCEYNLYGATQPRCPECGYRFTWAELLAAGSEPHPYIFEHHPESWVRSYFRTAWKSWRCKRFWTELRPGHRVFAGRLALYWALGAALVVLTIAADFTLSVVGDKLLPSGGSTWAAPWPSAPLGWRIEQYLEATAWGIGLAAVWTALTFLVLQVFAISMHRVKVSPRHAWRCVAYGLDPFVIAVLLAAASVVNVLTLAGYLLAGERLYGWSSSGLAMEAGLPPVVVVAYLLWFLRLRSAYAHYMRFNLPTLTVLSSQIIVVLLILAVLVNFVLYL